MDVSKNVVAALLVLFIIVSVVGTWSALTYISGAGVSIFQPAAGPAQGQVFLQVVETTPMQGQVQLTVI